MGSPLSRRQVLGALAATGILAFGVGRGAAAQTGSAERFARLAVWFRRTYPASCEILGSEHLDEATPWVAIDWDDYEAVTRRLAARIAQDYLDERIMRVNGFVLSRTEAALHGVLVPWLGVSA